MIFNDESFDIGGLQEGELFLTDKDAEAWLEEAGIVIIDDHILMSRMDNNMTTIYGNDAKKALNEAGIQIYRNGIKLSEFNGNSHRDASMFDEVALL